MLHKNTFDFIKELAKNNNREWFAANKQRYEELREQDLFPFIAQLIKELAAIDPEFSADTEPKKALLRIYRDIRFSPNKDPYKKHYGIAFDIKGYSETTQSYYLHIEQGNSFFGAGFWQPEAHILKMVREEIDYNGSEFLEVVNNKEFKSVFKLSEEGKLKKAPKGYESDHPQIEWLKLKSFAAMYPIADSEFLKPGIVNKLKTAFAAVQPFILFLRKATAA